ncbi:MAG: hypothetical protein ABI614_08960 [Planctomycetota bacterium]
MELPEFNDDGVLPPGDYELTFDQIRESPLVCGPADSTGWDVGWRLYLVAQLEVLTRQLWQVGIADVFADGSFAEDKDHPNDIDGYFVCSLAMLASGQLERKLNLLDPYKIWTWDPALRKPYAGYPKLQLPMWHRYRVELYPHVSGISSGIRDRHGNELEFPAAFRLSRRNDCPRGIIKLCEEDLE